MATSIDTQPPTSSSEESQRFPILSILRMLWKRKWLILAVWGVTAGLSIGVVHSLPAVYKAEAVILVDSQKIPESFVSSTVTGDIADRLALITQNVMTSARLLGIIDDFDLYRQERSHLTQEELLRKMRDDISIGYDKSGTSDRTQAFRLGYQGRNAKTVAAVTNRLASLYVEENVRTREDQAQGTVTFLRRQLQEAKSSLDDQERKVARFKQEHNGTLPEQQSSLLGMLNSLGMQLEGIQTSIARVQESKLSLQASLSAAESSEATLRAGLRQAQVSAQSGADSGAVLKPRSEILEAQLRQLRLRYLPEYPDVIALERQIAEAKREESEASATAQSGETNPADRLAVTGPSKRRPMIVSPELLQITERIATIRAQIAVTDHQAESLEKERQQITAAISDCQARISKLPLVEQEMAALKRNYEESANNYNSLLQKQLAAGMATDMERSQKSQRFTISDPARVPEKPIKPKRPLLTAIGCIASLVVSLLVGFAIEFRKQRFLGEWELPAGTVVLGRVPRIEMMVPTGLAKD